METSNESRREYHGKRTTRRHSPKAGNRTKYAKPAIARKAAQAQSDAWKKENTTQFTIRFFNKADAEIIEALKNAKNRTDYLRQLILADIKKSRE